MPRQASRSSPQRFTREQRAAVADAVSRGLSALQCEEPISLADWADRHFKLSEESSHVAGDWITLPYQRALMNAISNDDIPTITFMKPKRVGFTKILDAAIGYFAARLRRSGVVYCPTESDRDAYVGEHVDPMLRDVAPVRDALLCDPTKKSKHNTKEEKHFSGAIVHLRGGKSGRAYRQLTKDFVFYDELAAFDADIDAEGSPTYLGDGRVEGAPYPKSIRGSSPKLRGSCQIEASMMEADFVFWRFVRCSGCRQLHRLGRRFLVYDPDDIRAGVWHACPLCGYSAVYGELAEMDAGGEWRTLEPGDDDGPEAPGPVLCDDDGNVREVESMEIVPCEHIAFRMWSAYSYFKPWAAIARETEKAKEAEERGDVAPMKTLVNTVYGETFEETEIEADEDALVARREDYTPDTLPLGVLALTAGVDIQGGDSHSEPRIEVSIIGWGIGEESWHVEATAIPCDPTVLSNWDRQLDEYLALPRRTVDGRELRVLAVGVDTGHATDAAYAYCLRRARTRPNIPRAFALKGRGVEKDRPIASAPTVLGRTRQKTGSRRLEPNPHAGLRLYTVGSFNAKKLVLRRLQVATPGPGYCHLPRSLDGVFCAQLTAEKLVSKQVGSRTVQEFVEVRRRNEALDMLQYALVALYLLDPARILRPAPARPAASLSSTPAESASPPASSRALRKQRDAGRGGNWVKGWR